MITVYAISSLVRNYIYVGQTEDIDARVSRHNNGWEKTTRPYKPFQLIYSENFPDRSTARKKEKYLKTGLGKDFLRKLK